MRLLDRDRAIKLAEVVMKERGEVSPFADRPKPAAKVTPQRAGMSEDRGPAGISDWEVKRQAKDLAERAMLLKVREVVTGMDGLDEGMLARLVCGIMLESLFEYDQGEVVMNLLSKLGYSIPSESAREEMDLAAQVKEARFAIFEDLGGVGTGQHTDAWLVIVALLGSYAAFESPSGMAFLKELGIDADAMRAEAVEQVKQADAERLKRAGEAKKRTTKGHEGGTNQGSTGSDGVAVAAKKASKGAKKAPKTAKKAAKTAKKAPKKG